MISVFIASRFLDSVPLAAIGYFRESAEKLIEEKGAVEALAAALAHISGATSLEQRSLLNSDAVSVSETEIEQTRRMGTKTFKLDHPIPSPYSEG